ncbi:hypothetical protein LEP1GSC109_1020 [Leptospira interrogans str. UI 13372]|nr:hypothetical protein LEP1GSC109_1020 [Leptospira interrogans str. UI 13372]
MIAPAGTHDSKLLFPNLNKFRILRNSKVLKPEILSLDKAYVSKTIKDKLKKRNIQYRIPNKKNAKNPEWIAPLILLDGLSNVLLLGSMLLEL